MHYRQQPLLTKICLGALAGAVASWTMARTTDRLDEWQSARAPRQEEEALRRHLADDRAADPTFGGMEHRAAAGLSSGISVALEKAARRTGRELSLERRRVLTLALQVGLSVGAGITYALLRPEGAGAKWGYGLAFGTALWLLVDEVGSPILGLTPRPGEFPWQAHARGLAGHLVLGSTLEAVLALGQPKSG